MKKAVIFDAGGVLVYRLDSKGNIDEDVDVSVYEDIAKTYNINVELAKEIAESTLIKLDIYNPERNEKEVSEIGKEFFKQLNKNSEVTSNRPMSDLVTKGFSEDCKYNLELIEFIKNLKSQDTLTAILSNTSYYHAKSFVTEELKKNFDVEIYSYDVGFRKPQKEIWEITLEKLRKINPELKMEDCIYIDNKEEYVKTAKELGMKGIHYIVGKHSLDNLKEEIQLLLKK